MRLRGRLAAAAAALVLLAPSFGAEGNPPTGAFSEEQVNAAITAIKKDPNLSRERTITTLKWIETPEDKEKAKPRDWSWLKWIGELFSWVTQSGRYVFWVVLAILAGLLIVYLGRLVRTWSLPKVSGRVDAPSFVRDLDIRPESLPSDIGAAARQLWDTGEHRSALALLYRGLLSRLVHVHGVPIKDSTTEGDCLSLAHRHLKDEERKTYVSSLVRLWQRAVYGGDNVPSESVYALCDGFARALDQPEIAAVPPGAAAAGARA